LASGGSKPTLGGSSGAARSGIVVEKQGKNTISNPPTQEKEKKYERNEDMYMK